MTANEISQLQVSLINWYKDNHRDLPWRRTKDPYAIWISEVMLQQTTVTAVLPYYETFLKKFPKLDSLAQSSLSEVLEIWAGLGYYSRARNLHRAACAIAELGQFPSSSTSLSELPGFGPYTSRAVATFAFKERVGVLDGNVIRVLSRLLNLPTEHWKPNGRQQLQVWADRLAQVQTPDILNQALIEIGATICAKQNPSCFLCPWSKSCLAKRAGTIDRLPLKKPKAKQEIWLWMPTVTLKTGKIALMKNDYLPFLKGQWIFPGTSQKITKKPKQFDVKHAITKYDIYVQIKRETSLKGNKLSWVSLKDIKKVNPTNLIQKVLRESQLR